MTRRTSEQHGLSPRCLPTQTVALDLVDKNDDEGYAAAAQAAGGLELLKAGAGEGSSVFLIEFADGFRAALLHAQGGFVSSW